MQGKFTRSLTIPFAYTRLRSILAAVVVGAMGACAHHAKPAASAAVARPEERTGVSLRPPETYEERHDPSGWTGTSAAPTARGGGPPATSTAEDLRRTPSSPRRTDPAPIGASLTGVGETTPAPVPPAPSASEEPPPPEVSPRVGVPER